MSKRGAGNYLTDQNWDQEDDAEEAGEFAQASKEVLQTRQIKKAKRRGVPDGGLATIDAGGVFKGFTGFVSTTSPSEATRPLFSFGGGAAKPLFGLINGGPSSHSSFTSTTSTGSANSGSRFTSSDMQSTTSTSTTSTAGRWSPTPQRATGTVPAATGTVPAATGTPAAKETPPAATETPTAAKETPPAATETPSAATETPAAAETPMATEAKALTSRTPPSAGPGLSNGSGGKAPSATRAKYLQQLKSLNEGVAKWVQEHVAKNPYCILTPIFKDYEKHLAGIEAKFPSQEEEKTPATADKAADEAKGDASKPATDSDTPKPESPAKKSAESPSKKTPESAAPTAPAASSPSRASLFTFGASALGGAASKGFGTGPLGGAGPLSGAGPLGGAGTKPLGSGPLGGGASSTFGSGSGIFGAGMSSGSVFGGLKPLGSTGTSGFSFAASKPKEASDSTGAAATGGEDEYVPPKPEVTAVKEDDAFYTKRCKLFFQKDEQWKEKGVGNLFLKPCSDKTQLLIRADTSLGNILLNIMLAPSLPLSRQGKNNVTLACVPNPPMDEKHPDDKTMVPMLIRVKTAEDADELFQKLKEKKE